MSTTTEEPKEILGSTLLSFTSLGEAKKHHFIGINFCLQRYLAVETISPAGYSKYCSTTTDDQNIQSPARQVRGAVSAINPFAGEKCFWKGTNGIGTRRRKRVEDEDALSETTVDQRPLDISWIWNKRRFFDAKIANASKTLPSKRDVSKTETKARIRILHLGRDKQLC